MISSRRLHNILCESINKVLNEDVLGDNWHQAEYGPRDFNQERLPFDGYEMKDDGQHDFSRSWRGEH